METNKRFLWFTKHKDNVEDAVEEDRSPTLKFFFKLLWRRIGGLFTLNFIMLLMMLPIAIGIYVYVTSPMTPTTLSPLYAPLYGVSMISDSPSVSVALSTVSAQLGFPVLTPTGTIVILVMAVLLLLTWGIQNAGATYVLRGFFRGEAVFVLSDYLYGIKRNWKQAIFVGFADLAIMTVLAVDFIHLYQTTGSTYFDLMYAAVFAIAVIYFFMRFYIYLLMITFEMKFLKILKNSLIFAVLGIKRNLLAALGIAVMLAFNIALLFLLLPSSIPIILPCIYLFSFSAFMATYAAYPIIDRYLIKPYETPAEDENVDEEDVADVEG